MYVYGRLEYANNCVCMYVCMYVRMCIYMHECYHDLVLTSFTVSLTMSGCDHCLSHRYVCMYVYVCTDRCLILLPQLSVNNIPRPPTRVNRSNTSNSSISNTATAAISNTKTAMITNIVMDNVESGQPVKKNCIHTYILVCTCLYRTTIHTLIYTRTHAYTNSNIHTCAHTYIHTYIHTLLHTQILAQIGLTRMT